MTITSFIVSLVALILLLTYKVFEVKVRKIHFLGSLFKKGDEKIHTLAEVLIFKYHRYKKISKIFLIEFLPAYLSDRLMDLRAYLIKKYLKAEEEWRGRRVLRDTGTVSFFLERLSEEKPTVKSKI